jgi:hypothetical protein
MNAGAVLAQLLDGASDAQGYVPASVRATAATLKLTVHQFRRAQSLLLQLHWIESRPRSPTTVACFRVTEGMFEALQGIEPRQIAPVRERLTTRNATQGQEDAAYVRSGPAWEVLNKLNVITLTQRLLQLNRVRRDRYQWAYHKATLRNVSVVLFWFIVRAQTEPTVPIVVSLRHLARETRLVYATTKRARDHLLCWGVLTQHGECYALCPETLTRILTGEDELPGPEGLSSSTPRLETHQVPLDRGPNTHDH